MRAFWLLLITNVFLVTCQHNILQTRPEVTKQYGLALEAIFGMGVRLQAVLDENPDKNFIVSPISATVVIAHLMLGADGKFRDRLFDILSLPNRFTHVGRRNFVLPFTQFHLQMSQLLKDLDGSLGNFTLKEKSALFFNNKTKLNTQFEWTLRKLYDVDIEDFDFERLPSYSQKYINDWGSNNTNGLIKTILAAPPSGNTGAIFANALYFLAEWQYPFSDMLNRQGAFSITEGREVQVTYMINLVEQIWYSESSTYRVICLPYKNEELGMYILLPNADNPLRYNIKEFTKSLKAKEILETISKSKRKDVTVKIPKMTLSSQISILQQLKKYNAYRNQMENVQKNNTDKQNADVVETLEQGVDRFQNFSANSDQDIYLSNAAEQPLKVSEIVQQIIFTVNEKGTEAAAITASIIDYSGGGKNFIVTRPFVFFIRHAATSVTLFWGTISNPLDV